MSLGAQGFQLSGRVVAVQGPDTLPLTDHWVTLHQVGLGGGASVDSGRTDEFGVYFLRAPHRDTSSMYIASVQFKDITYFSNPVRTIEFTSDTAATMAVFDTSSVAPAIALAQRHLVIRTPRADGSRSVLELIVLANRGSLTRVAPDPTRPVWSEVIPANAINLEVGDSDISSEALHRRGDTLALIAPMPPGEKQLVVSYTLPATDRLQIPVDQPADRIQLLIEDTAAVVTGGVLEKVGVEALDTLRFARFEAAAVPMGSLITIAFTPSGWRLTDFWWVVVLAAVSALVAVPLIWWRRAAPVVVTGEDPDVLAAQIALLDDQFDAHRADVSDGDQTAYENRRAELKARLANALARRSTLG